MDVVIDSADPSIPVLSFNAMRDGKQKALNMANLRTEFVIKNIGNAVANDVFIYPTILFLRTLDVGKEQARICQDWKKWTGKGLRLPFTWSSVFPNDEFRYRIAIGAWYESSDMAQFPATENRPGNWLAGTLFGCVSYQYPKDYQTSAVFDVMGEKDRFLKVGKELKAPQVRVVRDTHYDYAQ